MKYEIMNGETPVMVLDEKPEIKKVGNRWNVIDANGELRIGGATWEPVIVEVDG